MKKYNLLAMFMALFATLPLFAQTSYEMVVEKTDGNKVFIKQNDIKQVYFRAIGENDDDSFGNILLGNDSDFENGNLGNWGTWSFNGSCSIVSPGYQSNYCVALNTETAVEQPDLVGQIQYLVDPYLEPGKTYRIQFYAKSNKANTEIAFRCQDSNKYEHQLVKSFTIGEDWTLCRYVFTLPDDFSDVDEITIDFSNEVAICYVDNIKFGPMNDGSATDARKMLAGTWAITSCDDPNTPVGMVFTFNSNGTGLCEYGTYSDTFNFTYNSEGEFSKTNSDGTKLFGNLAITGDVASGSYSYSGSSKLYSITLTKQTIINDPNNLLPRSLIDNCEEGYIPQGFIVMSGGVQRVAGQKYSNGSRVFAFASGGDFTRAIYFRNDTEYNSVEYGGLEGYKLPLEAGQTYTVSFNFAAWKGGGEHVFFRIFNTDELGVEPEYEEIISTSCILEGNKGVVSGSTSYKYTFKAQQTGNYILRWYPCSASGNMGQWMECLLANVEVVRSGNDSSNDNLINGIYYSFNSEKRTAEVIAGENHQYSGNVSIPATVNYKNVTYTVTKIHEVAFYDNRGLSSITFPNTLTEIGEEAFRNCSNLKEITLPNSLTTIEDGAFQDCVALTTVHVGTGIQTIKKKAFGDCYKLKDFYCDATTPPTLRANVFQYSSYSTATLHVPNANTYRNADSQWAAFGNIVSTGGDDDNPQPTGTYQGAKRVFGNVLLGSIYNETDNITEAWTYDSNGYPTKITSTSDERTINIIPSYDDGKITYKEYNGDTFLGQNNVVTIGSNGYASKLETVNDKGNLETVYLTYNADEQLSAILWGSDDYWQFTYSDGDLIKINDNGSIYDINYETSSGSKILNTGSFILWDEMLHVDLDDIESLHFAGLLGKGTKHLPISYVLNRSDHKRYFTNNYETDSNGRVTKFTYTTKYLYNDGREETKDHDMLRISWNY